MELTKNFHSSEYFVSKQYPELARAINQIKYLDVIQLHAESIMQPIRDHFSKYPMTIISGVRSPRLNQEIGGSNDSDHLYGCAADFTSKNLYEMYLFCIYSKIPYRQIIYYPKQKFVHISNNIPGKTYKNDTLVKTSTGYGNFNKGV